MGDEPRHLSRAAGFDSFPDDLQLCACLDARAKARYHSRRHRGNVPAPDTAHLPARLFWKTKVALGRRQADALVTVSGYARRTIIDYFGVPPESVFVVGEAGDPAFRRLPGATSTPLLSSHGIDGTRRMIVYVGGFSPHKNLEALVGSFAALVREDAFHDTLLVMVGEHRKETFHSYFGSIAAQVARLGLKDRVIFPGYLPDDELAVLLNLAAVLALPSLMEGFGLPAIEAAACGCPVVATKASPLPELLGEGAHCNRSGSGRARERAADRPRLPGVTGAHGRGGGPGSRGSHLGGGCAADDGSHAKGGPCCNRSDRLISYTSPRFIRRIVSAEMRCTSTGSPTLWPMPGITWTLSIAATLITCSTRRSRRSASPSIPA